MGWIFFSQQNWCEVTANAISWQLLSPNGPCVQEHLFLHGILVFLGKGGLKQKRWEGSNSLAVSEDTGYTSYLPFTCMRQLLELPAVVSEAWRLCVIFLSFSGPWRMNLGHVCKFMPCTIKARVVFVWLVFTVNANSQTIAHLQELGLQQKGQLLWELIPLKSSYSILASQVISRLYASSKEWSGPVLEACSHFTEQPLTEVISLIFHGINCMIICWPL